MAQVLAAACAAGVSSTFGAPVGGVLFSVEVTSTYYSISHLWKAMFTSVCGALLFRVSRGSPTSGGGGGGVVSAANDYGATDEQDGSLALFHLTNFATQDLRQMLLGGEMVGFTVLGVLCGLCGAAFVHATSSLVQLVRQLRSYAADESVSPAGRRRGCGKGGGGGSDGSGSEYGNGGNSGGDGGNSSGSALRRSDWFTPRRLMGVLLSRYGYTLCVAFVVLDARGATPVSTSDPAAVES